jgi:hypothetical protein
VAKGTRREPRKGASENDKGGGSTVIDRLGPRARYWIVMSVFLVVMVWVMHGQQL